MKNELLKLKYNKSGFTIIEAIISIAVVGILGTGIAIFLSQTISVNASNSSQMQALQQVEKAGYWVGFDVQQAQTVSPAIGSGFPLQLSWTDWSGNSYQSTYTITGGTMQRSLIVNSGPPTVTFVAQSVNTNSTLTNCTFFGGQLTLEVTATIGKFNETRTYQLKPRPG